MINYEDFKVYNLGFAYRYGNEEEQCKRNYEIARRVEQVYNETFANVDNPRPLDIVEFSNGCRVFKHGQVCENLYHDDAAAHGMITLCENGSTHTNGRSFSTSGGAFHQKHKSLFKPAGTDTCLVWAWGCNGSGASQGIYFPIKVRRWVIPYEKPQNAVKVYIYGKGGTWPDGRGREYAVAIEGRFDYCHNQEFESIHAFLAWADYVGFQHKPSYNTFHRVGAQRLQTKYVKSYEEIPAGSKPIKAIYDCRAVDAWVFNDGDTITEYINTNAISPRAPYNTEEGKRELAEFRKYADNPLGV